MAEKPSTIRVQAPAKVNLILRVLDRRADGYHNLWSLMHTVGLTDRLTLRLTDRHQDIRLQCNIPDLPTDGRNLVVKAATQFLAAAVRSCGVEIELQKTIPMGGGLGGGSSDAAATLMALNRLLGLDWPPSRLAGIGAGLGSDVPFFLFAPSAVISGKGEAVVPVTVKGSRWIVLVNPGAAINTGWAYQRLAEQRTSIKPLSAELEQVSRSGSISWDEVLPLMENDFEPALAASHPVLADLKAELCWAGAEAALLSGSGATVFGVFQDESRARRASARLEQPPGRTVFTVPAQ